MNNTNYTLIGSQAMKYWFPDFKREPKDTDYAYSGELPSIESEGRVEWLPNPVFLENCCKPVALPEELLTLKMSHIFWHERQFEKTMWDIQFLLDKGYEPDTFLFKDLYLQWTEMFGKNRRADLKMSSDDFFDNAINPNMPVHHDTLHEFLNPEPVFKQILVGEVETSDELFEKLSHESKIQLIQEETMVMAAERYRGLNYRVRYARQLNKMILGHLTIPEAFFAIINYKELLKPPYDFIEKINLKLTELNLKGLN